MQNLALRRLSAGQMLSRAAANTPSDEQSLQAGKHHNAGFSPFHALILPIVAQLSQPRVQKAFKRARDIVSPSVCKARGASTSAPSHCVFPPPNSQSPPSEPERHRCLSSHAVSLVTVNRRCLDGSRPSSPSPVLSVRAVAADHHPLLACGVS